MARNLEETSVEKRFTVRTLYQTENPALLPGIIPNIHKYPDKVYYRILVYNSPATSFLNIHKLLAYIS